MKPLDALHIEVTDFIAAGPSGLWVHGYNRRRVRCLSWEGVVKSDLRLPDAILELVEDEDGSLIFRTASGLKRWRDGKVVPTWPRGCLRVFFGAPADKRIVCVMDRDGQVAWRQRGRFG